MKVGFSIVDLGTLAKSLGFKQPDYGGFEKQSEGRSTPSSTYINKNGGMGGRQVQASIKRYVGGTDSPAQSEAQCKGFTQDEKVAAVDARRRLPEQHRSRASPRRTPSSSMQALLALDQTQFEKHSPYLWSPTHPEYAGFVKAQLTAMKDAKFFDGNTGVLLMPSDDEVSRRVTDDRRRAVPASRSASPRCRRSYIDSTNTGTLGATSAAALTAGKNGKLNRVIVIGGARIQPVALVRPDRERLHVEVGRLHVRQPDLHRRTTRESIVTELRNGMTGLGYAPAQDVDQNQRPAFPDPTNPAQKQCYDIVTRGRRRRRRRTCAATGRTRCSTATPSCSSRRRSTRRRQGRRSPAPSSRTPSAKIGDTYHSSIDLRLAVGSRASTPEPTPRRLLRGRRPACCFNYTGGNVTFGAAPVLRRVGLHRVSPRASARRHPRVSHRAVRPAYDRAGGATGSVPLETITVSP